MDRRRSEVLLATLVFGLTAWFSSSFVAEHLGLCYDEPVYLTVGERHLNWYASLPRQGLRAFTPVELDRYWHNWPGTRPVDSDWHPAVGKLLLALGSKVPLPGGVFARWRLANTLLYALTGALLCWWLGRAAGRTAGAAAALAWATMPRAQAHGNLANLDLPAAAFATLALWAGWHLLREPTRWRVIGYGVAVALAAGSKFNGGLVAPAVILLALGWRRSALVPVLVATLLVAPLTFVLLWPWLWYDGWSHWLQVVTFHGRHGYIATEYFGRIWTDPPPPWHFPLVMLAITTPTAILATATLAGRAPRQESAAASPTLAVTLLVAAVCHLLPFCSPEAAKYNGVRLLFPVLPLLAGLSGLGVAALVGWLRQRLPAARSAVAAAGLAGLVYLPAARGLLEVHPHPMAYYNALVGGPAGANRRGFELSYWGDPFRPAMAWLSQHGAPDSLVHLHPPGAIAMVEMYRSVGLLRDDLQLTDAAVAPGHVRYYVYQNRRSEWDQRGFELLATVPPRHVVTAAGAPVAFIWELPPEPGRTLPSDHESSGEHEF